MHRVTATEAARNLSDLLNRIRYRGESFEIERNGEVIARMSAATPLGVGLRGFLDLLERLSADGSFADDLERVQKEQPALPSDPWAT